MLESLIVGSILLVLGFLSFLVHTTSLEAIVAWAVGLVGIGLGVGIPTGAWYHVRLRQALLAKGPLPARWWLRPVSLHLQLTPEEWRPIRLWHALGAIGWILAMLGCVAAAIAVVRVLSLQ